MIKRVTLTKNRITKSCNITSANLEQPSKI